MLSGILPPIPNLEIGYIYQFGNKIRTGRLTFDYVLPATIRNNQAFFGEAHAEFTNFGKTLKRILHFGNTTTTYSGFDERSDLSIGGGYRKLFGESLMLGVNGFYDATMLSSSWYGSGGIGFEMVTMGAGHDLVEFNFNYYGDIFQGRNSIINAFRNGPLNYDASLAYSLQLGDDGPDLRLKLTGYRFDIGTARYGMNADAELKAKNGVWSLKAGTGHDPVNGWYHTVGGFVNVGVQLERLLYGESPITMPEPIFKSPRNLSRLLVRKVDREYLSPPAMVSVRRRATAGGGAGCSCPYLPGGPPGSLYYTSFVDINPIAPGAYRYYMVTAHGFAQGTRYAGVLCVQGRVPSTGLSRVTAMLYSLQQAVIAIGRVLSPCRSFTPFILLWPHGTRTAAIIRIDNQSATPYTPGTVHFWVTSP
jgi:hypothetical protein